MLNVIIHLKFFALCVHVCMCVRWRLRSFGCSFRLVRRVSPIFADRWLIFFLFLFRSVRFIWPPLMVCCGCQLSSVCTTSMTLALCRGKTWPASFACWIHCCPRWSTGKCRRFYSSVSRRFSACSSCSHWLGDRLLLLLSLSLSLSLSLCFVLAAFV